MPKRDDRGFELIAVERFWYLLRGVAQSILDFGPGGSVNGNPELACHLQLSLVTPNKIWRDLHFRTPVRTQIGGYIGKGQNRASEALSVESHYFRDVPAEACLAGDAERDGDAERTT